MARKRAPAHKKRVPMHKQSAIAVTNKDPNFVYRIVNDSEGRVDQFLAGGYTIAEDSAESEDDRVQSASQMGSVKRMVVNRGRDADTKHAVLMKIPREMYDEDQKEKQRQVDETTASYDPGSIKARGNTYGEGLTEEYK